MLQQLYSFAQAGNILLKINALIASVPSFGVSSILMPVKIEDVFPVENPNQYAV